MNTAYLCVLAAALMPYLFVGVSKSTSKYIKTGNAHPRDYAKELTGVRQRAYWAHLNAFEAFAPFAAAVILASLAGVAQSTVDTLALTFIACRLLHGVFYLADLALLRSVAWSGGIACVLALFLQAASA